MDPHKWSVTIEMMAGDESVTCGGIERWVAANNTGSSSASTGPHRTSWSSTTPVSRNSSYSTQPAVDGALAAAVVVCSIFAGM